MVPLSGMPCDVNVHHVMLPGFSAQFAYRSCGGVVERHHPDVRRVEHSREIRLTAAAPPDPSHDTRRNVNLDPVVACVPEQVSNPTGAAFDRDRTPASKVSPWLTAAFDR